MKSVIKPVLALAFATALSGCIDDLLTDPAAIEAATESEILNGGTGTSGGTYTILPPNYQCPSTCTLANAASNDQTASQCDAARSAYLLYTRNAEEFNRTGPRCETVNGVTGCVDIPTLQTLYDQFQTQNQLAGDVYQSIGC